MYVTFEDATVIQAETLTSAKGRQYGKLRFISSEMDVFDLFVSERDFSALTKLSVKESCDLVFQVVPGFRGGVELRLC